MFLNTQASHPRRLRGGQLPELVFAVDALEKTIFPTIRHLSLG